MTFDFSNLHLQPPSLLALTLKRDSLAAQAVRLDDAEPGLPPVQIAVGAGAVLADPAKAGAALAAALDAARIKERRCALCLPPAWVLSTSADIPEISPEDLRGYFELRAEREFSMPELLLAHDTYQIPGSATPRATLAALPAKRMEAVETFLHAAGCHPASISLDLPVSATPEPALHLFCEGGAVEVAVTCGTGVATLRSLSGDPAILKRELRITLGRLPEALRAGLKTARLHGPPDEALPALLEKLGLATACDDPDEPAQAAAEAARRVLNHQKVPFEYFTPEPNRWKETLERFNTPRGRKSAAAAAALIFLPVLMFTYRSHEAASLAREWNGMRTTVAELDTIQQKIRQFRPWFEPAPQKLQALKAVIGAFPDRGDVWTRSVQLAPYVERTENGGRGTPSTTATLITVTGFSLNNAALMNLQNTLNKQAGVSVLQLKQLRGNNPVQFSLTFKWEPRHE